MMCLTERVQTASLTDLTATDFTFDWSITSRDIFVLLTLDPFIVESTLPILQYPPSAQTSLMNGSLDEQAPSASVDTSREAVHRVSKIIKDLPVKLVAALENNHDYFFPRSSRHLLRPFSEGWMVENWNDLAEKNFRNLLLDQGSGNHWSH